MNTLPYAQGTPEWLAARTGRITASRMSAIMAKGKNGTPSATRSACMGELIAEYLTGSSGETYINADMQRGTDLEPLARGLYEAKTGRFVDQVGLVLHPKNERWGASPDGVVEEDGLLEIKCPRTHIHIEYLLAGKPPAAYLPQMAWQAACCKRKWVDFASFDPKMPAELQLFVVRYEPAAEYLAELEREADAFLKEMMIKVGRLQSLSGLIETRPDLLP
jgi:putative phage-type endonuclease